MLAAKGSAGVAPKTDVLQNFKTKTCWKKSIDKDEMLRSETENYLIYIYIYNCGDAWDSLLKLPV